ncbi:MAG TPA: serine/threonine-protein kinase [Candidatus Acidoferrales bacterium]|nr:serine/threonine-protein kinase [Candidatus Acidoferrales bacterium]
MEKIGRYEIVQELGRGAMGVVYRARDTQIGREVALKVIHTVNASAQDIEKYKQRFNREAQAAGRLSHPGIVTIHDIAEDDSGQPYIVMEFVEGRPLNLLLGPTAQVPLERLLDIGIQVAQALDYAHKNGVVHRDIKPPNILVTPDGRVKIADFGIARLEGTELTQEGTSLGTPSYMSPEQFRGGAIDGRSDIFSLGAVLYWMFTGHKPFPGENITTTSFQVAYENPPLPTLANAGLPKLLDEVLMRCLAKNPASRYSTGGDLAADLDAVKGGRPLPTKLGPHPERTEPFPLPSRKIEPSRPGGTVEVPASNPDDQTRVAIHATQTIAAQPPPSAKRNATPLLIGAGAVVLLALVVAGQWYWRRVQPSAPAPAAATPSVPAPSPAEKASRQIAPAQTPPSETAPVEPARKKPASASSAAGKSPAPVVPNPSSSRPSAPASAAAPAAFANLVVACKFPLKQGTLEITLDGNRLWEVPLQGKKHLFHYEGEIERNDNPIPAGHHTLHIRIADTEKQGAPVWEGSVSGEFARNTASRVEIKFTDGSRSDPGGRKLVLSLKALE